MTYGYRCESGHAVDVEAPMGEAPTSAVCACGRSARRDYSGVQIMNDDPWRRAWLSPKTTRALEQQNRPLDPLAPKDKFERRAVERATGRNYIGDDASGLRPSVQKAISAHEDKRRQREVA